MIIAGNDNVTTKFKLNKEWNGNYGNKDSAEYKELSKSILDEVNHSYQMYPDN